MQPETQYGLKLFGGTTNMDCRRLGFMDLSMLASKQFPGADGCDAIPNTCSNTINGIVPAFRTGGAQAPATGTGTGTATISSRYHLDAPAGVTATDTGANHQLQVTWSNTSTYDSLDNVYCYNNSGDAYLGMAVATAGSMLIDGLTNGTPYTIYLKVSRDGTTFSAKSSTSTATPTASGIDFPAVGNVWNGTTVNGAPGTLVEIAANNVRFGTVGGRNGNNITGTVHVPIAANVSKGVATDVSDTGTLDVGAAVLAATVEGTLTVQDALKVGTAVLIGRTSITPLGGGNATVKFKDTTNTTDRVTATMTGSERTNVTLNKT